MNLVTKHEDRSTEVLANIRKAMVGTMERYAPVFKATAQAQVPKRSGRLMRSIGTAVDEKKVSLTLYSGGKAAFHAHLVEFGTVKMPPTPYTRRTADLVRPRMDADMKRALGRPM